MRHILIVGGGITGLAAAHRLEQLDSETAITLVERADYLGGKIRTTHAEGFVVEAAPDSFLSRKPRGVGLCEELGLTDRLQARRPEYNHTFVRRHGELHPLPAGLTGLIPTNLDALANSTLISASGRERLAAEVDLPPVPPNGDESVGAFVTRRLGREVYEQLVEPLMSGIYAGNGDNLSLAATFPQLRQLELKHGSLLKGLQAGPTARRAPATYPPFVSLPGGMGALVEAILAKLERTKLWTSHAVETITRPDSGFVAVLDDGRSLRADALVLTTPAFVTARLVAALDPELAQLHAAIPYASAAIITLAYAEDDLPRPLDGYGYVIPQVEGTDVLACTWTSSKWAGRAPEGCALLRVYAGRFGARDVTELSDDELVSLAKAEVSGTLGIRAAPAHLWIDRWPLAMPQYLLGHVERVAAINARLKELPGLYLAGAAYRGVGIPDCIEGGEQAASGALEYLRMRHTNI